jgi:hypothetical protein
MTKLPPERDCQVEASERRACSGFSIDRAILQETRFQPRFRGAMLFLIALLGTRNETL